MAFRHPTNRARLNADIRTGATVMNNTTRVWAILTTVAGIATLAVTLLFQTLPEVAAGRAAECYAAPPVIAFEFARTANQASALFGPGDCRAMTITAMDAINRLDMAAYIPAYTLFAVFGALFAARGARPRLALLAILAAITALVADYVETNALLAITADLDRATDAMTGRASTAAWIKFFALGAHGLLVAAVCFRTAPRRWIVGGALVLPMLGVIAAATDPDARAGLITLGMTIGWLTLMAFAAKESVWGVNNGDLSLLGEGDHAEHGGAGSAPG